MSLLRLQAMNYHWTILKQILGSGTGYVWQYQCVVLVNTYSRVVPLLVHNWTLIRANRTLINQVFYSLTLLPLFMSHKRYTPPPPQNVHFLKPYIYNLKHCKDFFEQKLTPKPYYHYVCLSQKLVRVCICTNTTTKDFSPHVKVNTGIVCELLNCCSLAQNESYRKSSRVYFNNKIPPGMVTTYMYLKSQI